VFATRTFMEGETVETCPTVEIDESGGPLGDYLFESTNEGKFLVVLGFGMLYNHSAEPNIDYYQEDSDTLDFVALRRVERGEELTISYGDEWWSARDETPI
jgi:SET domain-containing protein